MNYFNKFKYIIGKYYGYPDCCIKAFDLNKKKLKHDKFFGSGFLPCPDCFNKDISDIIQYINNNRICSIPFNLNSKISIYSIISDLENNFHMSEEDKAILIQEFKNQL